MFTLALVDRDGPLALQPTKHKLCKGENPNAWSLKSLWTELEGNYLEQSRGVFTRIYQGQEEEGGTGDNLSVH